MRCDKIAVKMALFCLPIPCHLGPISPDRYHPVAFPFAFLGEWAEQTFLDLILAWFWIPASRMLASLWPAFSLDSKSPFT